MMNGYYGYGLWHLGSMFIWILIIGAIIWMIFPTSRCSLNRHSS